MKMSKLEKMSITFKVVLKKNNTILAEYIFFNSHSQFKHYRCSKTATDSAKRRYATKSSKYYFSFLNTASLEYNYYRNIKEISVRQSEGCPGDSCSRRPFCTWSSLENQSSKNCIEKKRLLHSMFSKSKHTIPPIVMMHETLQLLLPVLSFLLLNDYSKAVRKAQ